MATKHEPGNVGQTPEPTTRRDTAGATNTGTAHTPDTTEERRLAAMELAKERKRNRGSTDLGLLLLRVLPIIMVLHGIAKVRGYSGFRDGVAQNSFGALAPDLFSLMIVAGQLALPILIAVGFLTRLAALLMTIMMLFIWALIQLPQGLIDGRTGGLMGEGALLFAFLALPLVFTGPGRFSIDHVLFGRRAAARAERRAEKSVS